MYTKNCINYCYFYFLSKEKIFITNCASIRSSKRVEKKFIALTLIPCIVIVSLGRVLEETQVDIRSRAIENNFRNEVCLMLMQNLLKLVLH